MMMARFWNFGLVALLVSAAAGGADAAPLSHEPNPFAPAPVAAAARLDRAAMLGQPGSEAAIADWLAANPAAPAADRRALYHRLCEIYGVRSWHALRARACAAKDALAKADKGDDDKSMSALLAETLPVRAIGAATIVLSRNGVGSRSGDVTVRGITLPWIIDTGAEISVLPQSSADRVGVHYLAGKVNVGTTTADVTGRIAIIDILHIGAATVENVPVLVLPDERLTISGPPGEPGVRIPGVLGLPVLVAFRRMAWLDKGARLALGEDAPRAAGATAPIYWHDDGLGIRVETKEGVRGAHFDSGANSTYLYADGRPLVSKAEEKTAVRRTVHIGGAGGTIERQLTELPRLDIVVGVTPIALARVTLADDPGKVARIGDDVIQQLQALIFDFEHMTMSAKLAVLRASATSSLRTDPLLLKRSAIGSAQPLALDLFLGRKHADRVLRQWVESHPAVAKEDRAGARLLLCEEYYRRTEFRTAALACAAAEKILPGASGNFLALIEPAREVPPMRWDVAGVEVPLIKDSDGTRRLRIDHPGNPIEAVVDTGAETSVIMASVARRLGARFLGVSSLDTTTTPISGRAAVIDRLTIGSAHLLNLPVLVLPDAQLTMADGSSLPFVLSLSALTSAGKAAFLGHGTRLALGDAVPDVAATPVPLFWHPSGIGFEAGFGGGPRAVHLDTGSRRTYLYPAALSVLGQEERASRRPYQRKLAGLGGERTEQASRFAGVTVEIGGKAWRVAPMEMAPADEEGDAARIGAGIMDRFATVRLDFEAMEMFVE